MAARNTVIGWITADDGLALAGADLGFVYIGPDGAPETIDPDLLVDLAAPDYGGRTVVRPPHYGRLTPAARAAYLAWHHHGRRVAHAPTAWPLLLLYGLERRILVDGDDDDPRLRQEVADLGRVYGRDPEIRRITDALSTRPRASSRPALRDGPVPDALQVELGRRALASEPITAEWAMAWAWYHPDIPRRDAATKAPAEFVALWRHRFTERHPEGFVAHPKRRRLTLDHAPANPSLSSPLDVTVPDASDVFTTPGPFDLLRTITDEVESELSAYILWLARNPGAVGIAAAVAVLPGPLLTGSDAERAARPFVEHARAALGEADAVVVDAVELADRWSAVTGQAEAGRGETVALAQVLARYGIGLEPDVRFGGSRLGRRSQAVLFRLPDGATATPSAAYAAALVTLQLCAAVAAADGAIDQEESDLLVAQVDRAENLTDAERARMGAHRLLLTTTEVDLDDVAARAGTIDEDARRLLAERLVEVAWLDGVVTDGERRTVRAVHELLGLDPDDVDAQLGTGTAETATTPPAPDSTAPAPVAVRDPAAGLDDERLRVTQQQNASVQALLGAIFADDTGAGTEDDESAGTTVVGTLDPRHSGLLHDLAIRERTSRAELESAAARHGVLPDGAIDVINEAALDLTDDPVLEVHDDESVAVDPTIYEEMSA